MKIEEFKEILTKNSENLPESFMEKTANLSPKIFGMIVEKLLKERYNDGENNTFKSYRILKEKVKLKKGTYASDYINNYKKDFLSITKDDQPFLSNIQQIKKDSFDYMYYTLFFKESIVVFKISYDEIINGEKIKCAFTQPSGGTIKGQFQISGYNIVNHVENHLLEIITWEEFLNSLNDLKL